MVRTINRIARLIALCCLLPGTSACAGETVGAMAVHTAYVIDGDSIMVTKNRRPMEIRLWGIDAPEHDQSGSREAKNALIALVGSRQLRLEVKDRDKYGRTVALAYLGSLNVNRYMVENGYAWVHTYYCSEPVCTVWKKLEKRARDRGDGLWREGRPIPPWVWKARRHKKK